MKPEILITLRAQPFGPEPFGNELPSGLSLRVEDKAELLMAEGRPLRFAKGT